MKIVCVSDTHRQHNKLKLPPGDLLIHAGDINICTTEQLLSFTEWLRKQPFKYKVIIAGNHDELLYELSALPICKICKAFSNTIYLENSGCVVNGLKIYGSPYTPTFMDWYFMADRGKDIKKYWDKIPDGIDILVTHGPPMFKLDTVSYEVRHLGCRDLLNRVLEVKPKYHIFGHIHDSYGKATEDGITYINASVLNEEYQLVNEPIIIET